MNHQYSRILAIDFGLKRIGVAVSDPLGITAQGVCVIECKSKKKDIQQIMDIIVKFSVKKILMGSPIRFHGEPGTLQKQVEEFGRALRTASGVEVVFVDERLTTAQAERMLISADVRRDKRKEVIDMVAAQIFLQTYLDLTRLNDGTPPSPEKS